VTIKRNGVTIDSGESDLSGEISFTGRLGPAFTLEATHPRFDGTAVVEGTCEGGLGSVTIPVSDQLDPLPEFVCTKACGKPLARNMAWVSTHPLNPFSHGMVWTEPLPAHLSAGGANPGGWFVCICSEQNVILDCDAIGFDLLTTCFDQWLVPHTGLPAQFHTAWDTCPVGTLNAGGMIQRGCEDAITNPGGTSTNFAATCEPAAIFSNAGLQQTMTEDL
jgi:hypothetical protein